MSFFDDASLVLLTSGAAGKDGKAYSMKPTDGSGDFTFTRGSNLSATLVDSNGLIEKGRENLLLQSNQFDTTWVINTSVSEGEEGYDGTTDAWSLTRAVGGSLMGYQTVSLSGVSTYSIYAKINTNNGIGLALGGLSIAARFDLRDATKTQAVTETGIISSSQEYVGNGFYRLSITANVSGSTEARIYLTTADATTSDSNGGTHIIQDAQVEVGLAATEYIESGASTGKAGLLENEPRFDYSGGATCPSLLLEPSRTNILPYSEYFGTGWNLVTGTSIETNADTSPEGVENATRVTSIDHNEGLEYRNITVTENTSYTFSWYGKVTSGSQTPKYSIRDASNNAVIDSGDWPIVSNTEYKRQEVSFTTPVGCTNLWVRVSFYSGGAVDYYVYGAQLEAGSYPTSYIPNHSGGSVTRLAESFSATGLADYLGDSEGTIFIEGEMIQNTGFISLIETTNSGISIGVNGANQFFYEVRDTGVSQASIAVSGLFNTNTNFKLAGKYKTNDFEFFKDGASIGTDTRGNTFADGDLITINSNSVFPADQPFYGRIKQILVFPTALSDAQCIILTS